METWLLTEEGREHIKEAENRKNKTKPEYQVLNSLTTGNDNTVERIALKTGLDGYIVQVNLKKLAEKSWVWKKISRVTPF